MQQRFFLYTAVLSLLALGVALISQHGFGLRPCAWCVFQRLLLLVLFLLSLIGYIAMAWRQLWLGLLTRIFIIITAYGGVMAAWYQHSVAAKLFSCDMSFADQFMINTGLESSIPWLFGIYASCMDAATAVLGLDYALWALLFFALVGITNTFVLFRKAVI